MPQRNDQGPAGGLAASELLEAAAGGTDPEAFGAPEGRALVVVRVDDDPALPRLAELLRQRPCVAVGVADPGWWAATDGHRAPDLDVLLVDDPAPPAPWVGCDPGPTLERIGEQVSALPAPAVALVQLLRLGTTLDLQAALVAESLVYSMLQSGSAHRRWLEGRRRRPRRPSDRPVVGVDRTGPAHATLSLELRRPEVRNAFNAQMRDELVNAFELAALDPSITSVEVRGAGPSFCSGGDLDEFGTAPEPPVAHLVRTSRSAARALAGCAEWTTFFVHGASVGAGIELAALAGRICAEPGATFLLPELNMGLIPGAGGTATLPRRVGRQRTAYLGIVASPIDAPTALEWGLIDRIIPRAVGEPGAGDEGSDRT